MKFERDPSTYDKFIAYRAVIMQAIALAWRDKTFLKKLTSDPKRALHLQFGYRFPFKMDLEVIESGSKWQPEDVGDWHVLRDDFIELVLPPAPADEREHPEAWAAFNATHLSFLEEHHA